MHPDLASRWSEIEALLDEALDLPSEKRPAFLRRRCSGDERLLSYVERLVQAENTAPCFLDGEAAAFAVPMLPDIPGSTPGANADLQVGAYRLLHPIGHGGMGTVYLAERADGQFDQRVAIKLLRSDAPRESVTRRFLAERQILAGLNHPNIARLLDGGVSGNGEPYFVLEYVEGRPIDQYCDEERLSIRARLELFRTVCDAVHFAHQSLIVHRDLKPANMLVTENGRVKLLDFGIAKLLDDGQASHGAQLTETGIRWMTPGYAAPEQVRGEAVTTATDVYQLGVVLYELLSGHRPYRLARLSTYEIERAVCEEQPDAPSTVVRKTDEIRLGDGRTERITPDMVSRLRRTEVRGLRRRLMGDLDAIVLKALRKEPEARYSSVASFRDDVCDYLAGRPIDARHGSRAYHMRKFVERHRAGVTGGALAILAIVGLSTLYAFRLAHSAEEARAEARKADRTVEFLVSLFDQAHPANWKLNQNIEAALVLLEPAAERIEELENEPAVQARLLHTLGTIYSSLGRPDRAEALLQRALTLRRSLYGNAHDDVAATLYQFGHLTAPTRTEDAVIYFRAAAEIRRSIHNGDHPDLAWSLLYWARYLPLEDPEKNRLRDAAFAMLRRLHGPRSAEIAMAVHEYYVLGYGTRDPNELERMFRDVLSIEREVHGEEDTQTAVTMHNIGLLLDAKGETEKGLSLLRESHDINRRALGPNHPQVARMALNVAATLHEQARFEEAHDVFEEALDVLRSTSPDSSQLVAHALVWFGRNLLALEQPERAAAALREAYAIERLLFPGRLVCGKAQRYLARSLLAQQEFSEASALLEEAFTQCTHAWEADDVARRQVLEDLVTLNEMQERPVKAAFYRLELKDRSY